MEILRGSCIIGQSGGPTSVINASALGVIQAALDADEITRVLGAENGITGILDDKLFDFGLEDPEELELLRYTPSSALGSCRHKLADPEQDGSEYERILEIFQKYDVRYFFYIGGNDSMDTCNKVSKYMRSVGYPCCVIGVPKTIDNDLVGTDHCPGYGSAAKFIATTCAELRQDTQVYQTPTVNIVEIMGRHAGWLAAASALAGVVGQGPDLVYLPERDFNMEQFLNDIVRIVQATGHCLVAVSEGIHYADGTYINDVRTAAADGFGHVQLGGLAVYLADIVKQKLGYKARGIELSLLQRCAAHIASQTDIDESYAAGQKAVEQALNGETDCMIGFARTAEKKTSGSMITDRMVGILAFANTKGEKYLCELISIPLSETANAEKKVPDHWINEAGNGVTQEFIDYALPLIQGEVQPEKVNALPRYAKLKKIRVAE